LNSKNAKMRQDHNLKWRFSTQTKNIQLT